ncbi:hypothetical protein MANES_02G068550v8 [Manihot esculenta]|uniref:Uncharacterized protein n=1 Tax=Manihot esculenta TaxID=3983 RepID=A0ACB7I5Q4_MANES|nr:hypothetical protein MANES_02G068550v8 [Manihot esculenta]
MQTTTAIFAPENEETVSKQGNEAGPYPCPRPHQSRKHNRPLGSSYFSSQSLVRTYQSGIQFIAVRAFYFCELQWLRIFSLVRKAMSRRPSAATWLRPWKL